ncbi:arogenate dehydrogenase 2, chloroplastic-like protein, partial [Tanacetum coccineum]
ATDATQPYDQESKLSSQIPKSKALKIAIIGFGNFGQFLAKTLVRQGHTVLAHSRADYSSRAAALGVAYYPNADDLCEEHPEVILLCTSDAGPSIEEPSIEERAILPTTSRFEAWNEENAVILPKDFDILCTHPMFGPESGKNSWKDLTFVYDKVRIGNEESRVARCENFLKCFEREGCLMREMTCAEHDMHAAESQFITHTVGRISEKFGLDSTPINTKGYESLLDLVENTSSDSFELYYGLFMYNKNAMEQLERLDLAFESLKKELFGKLHEALRKQMFGTKEQGLLKLPYNGNGTSLPAESDSSNSFNVTLSLSLSLSLSGAEAEEYHGVINVVAENAWVKLKQTYFSVARRSLAPGHNGMPYLLEQPFHVLGTWKIGLANKTKKNDYISWGNGDRSDRKSVEVDADEYGLNMQSKHEGCLMREMTCAEHDMHAAESQFITHPVGRILEKNAMEQLERLDLAFESLKKELFGKLHEALRKQMFGTKEQGLLKLPLNGNGTSLPSESDSSSTSLRA